MPTENDVTAAIESVGQSIADHHAVSDRSNLTTTATAWKYQHGLANTETSNQTVARQAAFNTFLKSTLYTVYRLENDNLPPLTETTQLHDIQDYFAHAYAQTSDAAFADSDLDNLVWALPDETTLAPLLTIRHQLVNASNPTETIGKLYEKVSPQSARRPRGQFRTPPHIARLMTRWAIQSATDTVLDPGIGAGVLTAEAWQAKRQRHGHGHLTDMLGIDMSPLAVVMASTALKLETSTGTPQLYCGDFFDTGGPALPQSPSMEIQLPPVDSIVANPPYSRHQALDAPTKNQLQQLINLETDSPISGRAPLYVYFYIHATHLLKPGGRMVFLTPAEFLETTYGEQLKRFLLTNFHIRALVKAERETPIFDQAITTSCIAFLEKTDATTGGDEMYPAY